MSGPCHRFGPRFVGDPVDVVTGEVRDSSRDFKIHGARVFYWDRWYRTYRSGEERGIGFGHRHVLDWVLRFDFDGFSLDTPSEDIEFGPLWNPGDAATESGWTLERLSEAHFRVTRRGEPVRIFERTDPAPTTARLSQLHHDDGGVTTLGYRTPRSDASLVRVEDSQGWGLYLEWADGQIRAIHGSGKAKDTTFIRYEYRDQMLVAGHDAYGHTFRWAYDRDGFVTRKADRRGYGFVFEYHESGRCLRAAADDDVDAVSLRYNLDTRQTFVTHEGNGGQWEYRYGPSGNLFAIKNPYGVEREFVHNFDGGIDGETDGYGEVWKILRDEDGVEIGRRDPLGYIHEAGEDPTNPSMDPLAHDLPGTVFALEHGSLADEAFAVSKRAMLGRQLPGKLNRGLVAQEYAGLEVEHRDIQGLLVREDRVHGEGTVFSRRYAYDENGNTRMIVDREGGKQEWVYQSWNQRTLHKDALGAQTHFAYSKRDKLVAVQDPGGTRTDYEWDLCDRLVAVSRHGRVRERYELDAAGFLVRKTGSDGKMLVEYERGSYGTLLKRTGADGLQQEFDRDDRGRVIEATSALGTDFNEVVFGYDGFGTRVVDQRGGAGVEHRTRLRRIVETAINVVGPDGKPGHCFFARYDYNADGSVEVTDPTGKVHKITKVQPGVIQRDYANGLCEVSQYDSAGRCLSRGALRGSYHWRRRFLQTGEGDLRKREDERRGHTHVQYDAARRLSTISPPSGAVETYAYDTSGNLLRKPGLAGGKPREQAGSLLHDESEPVGIGPGNRLVRANGDRFYFDHRNHIVARDSAMGRTYYVRDSLDRLRRIELHLADGSKTTQWEAGYDAMGRRTAKRVHTAAGVEAWAFYWDRDRLAAEVFPDGRLRLYVYADMQALVPMLAIDYADADADPESGKVYVLQTDHRGAIESIEDEEGHTVWDATVSAYGDVDVLIGEEFHQPLRLVGQYHDAETGLSCHRYRYWSPELGRFMESDPMGLAGGMNLYAWPGCPLNTADVEGLNCPGQNGSPASPRAPDGEQPPSDEPASGRSGGTSASSRLLADFDKRAQRAASKSPTLAALLEELEQRDITIEKGPAGQGSYYDALNDRIVVDSNISGPEATGVIAHEAGHATYQAEPEYLSSTMSRDDYVEQNTDRFMADEGNAQFTAAQVRSEVLSNGGEDPGVPGARRDEYIRSYDDYAAGRITEPEAKKQMAETMGRERTSTTQEPYRDYYGNYYGEKYDRERNEEQ